MADIVGHHSERAEDEHDNVWGQKDFRILRCRGCEVVYFQVESIFSEDFDYEFDSLTGENVPVLRPEFAYFPSPIKRSMPNWASELYGTHKDLYWVLQETFKALNNGLPVLTAIGIRTAFDCASELIGVHPAQTFANKLIELVRLGKIGEDEKESLSVLADAGGAAAHRGWKPEPDELDTLMGIIEGFLYRAFILQPATERLKVNLPKRPKRVRQSPFNVDAAHG